MMSSADKEIKFWYKDLDWGVLELLLVWVDKENSMEFSLIVVYYLYTFCIYFYL